MVGFRRFLKTPSARKEKRDSSCIVLADPIDAAIDVVFVHGFGGHLTETWTLDAVCWPSELLQSDVKRARIIAFGYDADISQLLPQSQDSVSGSADQLLGDLAQLRANANQCDRPVLFVVHSLGSTVIKSALQYYSLPSVSATGEAAVARASRGVVFLGAAHRVTERETSGQIAAKAAAVVNPSFQRGILQDLERRSPEFDRINDLFLKFVEEKGEVFKTVTFYEEASPVAGEVKHESTLMDAPHHQLHGLRLTHNNMCRFAQHDDPNYVAISGVIRDFCENVIQSQRARCEVLYDSPDALIDVVFVHGLGYENVKLWTYGQAYWPKALLPASLPYSRVIAYHYHVELDAFLKPDQFVIGDLAIEFLLSLLNIRSTLQSHSSHQRPILFIAHSTGGTIVKQVLNISHLSVGPAMHAVSVATQGIIFFGTPHQNDKKSKFGQIFAKAVRVGFPGLGDDVTAAIEQDFSLETVNGTFQDYLQKREGVVQVVSLYEQNTTFLKKRIVTQMSASLPTQQDHASFLGSHATLCQFRTQDEYRRIIKQIRAVAGLQAAGKGCRIVHDSPGAQVDIIFVPGLHDAASHTWTSEGICWPRDILPHDLPASRVIIYGYNPDVSELFGMENGNIILRCSVDMLSDLTEIRRGDVQNRPIVFVAHSIGGLVVKNVVFHSHHSSEIQIRDIAACLCGIIFFGTPHRWSDSDLAVLGHLIAQIGQSSPREHGLRYLKQEFNNLQSVNAFFDGFLRLKSDNLVRWTFFEEKPIPDIGLVVSKFSAVPDDPTYQAQSIPATHIDMQKVASREDEHYQCLLGAIKEACAWFRYSQEREKARTNPLVDLIESERTYVDLLMGIVHKVAATRRSFLRLDDLDTMIQCIERIYSANESFLAKLKEIDPTSPLPKALGDFLVRWIDDFEGPYTTYCNTYCTGFDSWELDQSKIRLQSVLATFSTENPTPLLSEAPLWTLDALFLLPKARIKYYGQLYGRLLNRTTPGGGAHKLLVHATETLDILMSTIDSRKDIRAYEGRGRSTTASRTSPRTYPYKVKALYAYSASPDDPNEVSFSKGEILDILDDKRTWWQARMADGTMGVAPSNYLQILPLSQCASQVDVKCIGQAFVEEIQSCTPPLVTTGKRDIQ